jgi:hypothetical protein
LAHEVVAELVIVPARQVKPIVHRIANLELERRACLGPDGVERFVLNKCLAFRSLVSVQRQHAERIAEAVAVL